MDVASRFAGLKDRPDTSPDRRRDKGRDGRQPARTAVVTLIWVRDVEPPIKTPRGRALPLGCRPAATERQGPTTRAKFVRRGPFSQRGIVLPACPNPSTHVPVPSKRPTAFRRRRQRGRAFARRIGYRKMSPCIEHRRPFTDRKRGRRAIRLFPQNDPRPLFRESEVRDQSDRGRGHEDNWDANSRATTNENQC